MSDARPEGEAQEYMQRRARKPVSYAELDAPGHMRMGDQIVAALEAAGAIVPSSASDSSTSASASKEPRGFDLIELTDAVSKRMGARGAPGKQFPAIRQQLARLLASGKVRRRIVTASGTVHGDTESALRMLIASSLQIDPDTHAPWSLSPIELSIGRSSGLLPSLPSTRTGGGGSERSAQHEHRGAALVGRRIEVWWEGDACFHVARVLAYHSDFGGGLKDGGALLLAAHGPGRAGLLPPGTHMVEYEDDGLRVLEDLDGPGDPQLWRLCQPEEGAADETGSEAGMGSRVAAHQEEGPTGDSHGAHGSDAQAADMVTCTHNAHMQKY